MKSVKFNSTNELVIKNSRFITLLFPISSVECVKNILDDVKKMYPKATHYCYAYVFSSYNKSSDDGEPAGTAGMPILNVLLKEELNNVLAVVVRYFGGIKLGAGGLVRAYSSSVKAALDKSEVIAISPGYLIALYFNYNEEKNVNYLLKDYKIIAKHFDTFISYEVLVPKEKLSNFSSYDYKILDEIFVEDI